MFDKYLDATVSEMPADDVVAYVGDLDAAVIRQFLLWERDNENRSEVIEPLADRLLVAEADDPGYHNSLFFPRDGNLRRVFFDTEEMRDELTELGMTIHDDPFMEID